MLEASPRSVTVQCSIHLAKGTGVRRSDLEELESQCLKPAYPHIAYIAYLDPVFQTQAVFTTVHPPSPLPWSQCQQTLAHPPCVHGNLGVGAGYLKDSVTNMEAGRVGRVMELQLVVEGGAGRVWVNTSERVQHSTHGCSLWDLSPGRGGQEARQESDPVVSNGISPQSAPAWFPGTHTSSAGWQCGDHWLTARTLTVRSNSALAQGRSLSKALTCSFMTAAP